MVSGLTATEEDFHPGIQSNMNDLLGIRFVKHDTIFPGYIPWEEFPLRVQTAWYPIETVSAEKVLPLLKNWNEYDKEALPYPAVTLNRYGIYIAADIFTWYYKWQYPGLRHILGQCMELANSNKIVTTDAPQNIELALRRKGQDLIVHMINLSTDWDMDEAGAMFVESIPPIGPVTSKIKCERRPGKVMLEPEGVELLFRWENNGAWITLPMIHIHSAIVLKDAFN